jgi:lipopolysaccharide biosynthesis regulator YciM
LCEQAAACLVNNDPAAASQLQVQAIKIAPTSPRPRIELAHLQGTNGQSQEAFDTLAAAMVMCPSATPLLAGPIAHQAIASGNAENALRLLEQSYGQVASLDVLEAIVTLQASLKAPSSSARDWYVRHLEREPSLVAAAKWIAGEKLEHEQFHPQVQRALDHAIKPLTRYRCAACGFEATQHFWQCPGCQAWDSYPARRVEEL